MMRSPRNARSVTAVPAAPGQGFMRARVVPMRACRLVRSRSITSSGGGAAIGQFLQAGQARLGHAQPGDGLFVPGVGGGGRVDPARRASGSRVKPCTISEITIVAAASTSTRSRCGSAAPPEARGGNRRSRRSLSTSTGESPPHENRHDHLHRRSDAPGRDMHGGFSRRRRLPVLHGHCTRLR